MRENQPADAGSIRAWGSIKDDAKACAGDPAVAGQTVRTHLLGVFCGICCAGRRRRRRRRRSSRRVALKAPCTAEPGRPGMLFGRDRRLLALAKAWLRAFADFSLDPRDWRIQWLSRHSHSTRHWGERMRENQPVDCCSTGDMGSDSCGAQEFTELQQSAGQTMRTHLLLDRVASESETSADALRGATLERHPRPHPRRTRRKATSQRCAPSSSAQHTRKLCRERHISKTRVHHHVRHHHQPSTLWEAASRGPRGESMIIDLTSEQYHNARKFNSDSNLSAQVFVILLSIEKYIGIC